MSKYLIKMIDGGIKNIIEDGWADSYGCETCGYGGWHVKELELEMNGFSLFIKMGDMYDWGMPTHEDLIHWFDNNTEIINNMTQDGFIKFIKKADCFSCDEIKFAIQKEI